MFTTNVEKAAPVLWDKEVVESEWEAQAIVVNSGIANACTGKLGYEYCRETAGAAADALEISPQSVLICSTGVIGMQLPMEKNDRRCAYAGKGDQARRRSRNRCGKRRL